jgi:hypothetical protein
MEYSATYRRAASRSYWDKLAEYDAEASAEGGEPQSPRPAHRRASGYSPRREPIIVEERRTDATYVHNPDIGTAAGGQQRRARSRRHELPPYKVPPSPELPQRHIPTSSTADILTILQGPRDAANDKEVRDHLVLCVYRNSRKSFMTYKLSLLSKSRHPTGYITDRPFFRRVYREYDFHLRGWFRRLFSFKTITTVRLMQVDQQL